MVRVLISKLLLRASPIWVSMTMMIMLLGHRYPCIGILIRRWNLIWRGCIHLALLKLIVHIIPIIK
jgi:hypothetical protein